MKNVKLSSTVTQLQQRPKKHTQPNSLQRSARILLKEFFNPIHVCPGAYVMWDRKDTGAYGWEGEGAPSQIVR
jgi:hypothetical protein